MDVNGWGEVRASTVKRMLSHEEEGEWREVIVARNNNV